MAMAEEQDKLTFLTMTEPMTPVPTIHISILKHIGTKACSLKEYISETMVPSETLQRLSQSPEALNPLRVHLPVPTQMTRREENHPFSDI